VCVGEKVTFVGKRVRDRNAMHHHGRTVGDIVGDRESSWEIECVSGRKRLCEREFVCEKKSS